MSKPGSAWVAALCGILLVLFSNGAARAERKVALVVGNSQYKNAALTLSNPKNDAEDVATALRSLDFEVVSAEDASKRDFDLAMTKFARLAAGADAVLLYYAGHALQYQGRNYLMPVDSEVEDDISLRYQMVLLDDVLAAAERATGVKIVILDACRNNPIADNINRKLAGLSRGVSTTRGLARIDKALGMVVAYSTAADDVAADGSGRNSPFTSALLRRLREPGLEIGAMFRRIAADVNEKTQGRQRPETYVSLIGEYYLNQTDRPVWDQIKDTADASAFRSFIQRFPSSPRASDAQYRLTMLERADAARIAEQSKVEQARAEELRLREEARIKEAAAAKLAAERDRVEREAAAMQARAEAARKAEEERIRIAAAEQAKAAEQARLAELARLAEQARIKAAQIEEARIKEAQQKLAAAERERAEAAAAVARARQAEEERAKLAAAEQAKAEQTRLAEIARQEQQAAEENRLEDQRIKLAGLSVAPLAAEHDRNARPSPEQSCKEEAEKLAKLRISPSRDEVVRFDKALTCEKLRPQLVRLIESIPAEVTGPIATPGIANATPGIADPVKPVAPQPQVAIQTPADTQVSKPQINPSILAPVVAAPPARPQTKAASAAERRRAVNADCSAIVERAQLGELSDDDREILKSCRGSMRP
jgi:uncharacterized caspase-like protein